MADGTGQVAGRLEVIVEANLSGFAAELERKVEAAAKGVEAKIGISVDDEGPPSLREKIKAAVEKASAGVTANVGVNVDEQQARSRIREALSGIARRFGRDTQLNVETHVSEEAVAGSVAAAEKLAESRPIRIPLKARAGLWLDVLKEKVQAQAAVRDGIWIRTHVDETELRKFEKFQKAQATRGPRLRSVLQVGVLAGIASLIQPAVGAIEQAIGGLVAMAGAAAPAVGVLAGIGPALATGIQAGIGLTTALGGVGEAIKAVSEQQQALADGQKLTAEQMQQMKAVMDGLSPSAQKFVRKVVGLKDEWGDLRKVVQEPLFEPLNRRMGPVADRLLPVLEKGLEGTADTIGGLIDKTADWMDTKMFASDFDHIMTTNNGLMADFGAALLDVGKGMTDAMVAARPFTQRMGDAATAAGEWFRVKMARGRRSGGIEDFLDRAADSAGQLWRILQNVGGAIGGIFGAGAESGQRLLDTFEKVTAKWDKWVNSKPGQDRISQWFDNVEPGFREIGRIVRDTTKGLVKWAEDPQIVDMLKQIRTELGPAVNRLLTNLGDNLGPAVIDAITQLVNALANLSAASEPLTALLNALSGVLRVLNRMMEASPGITDAIAKIAGALILMGSMKRLGRLFKIGGKGGLIASLLGKNAGPQATAAAKGMTQAAGSGGRLARILGPLGALGKAPLMKKAGWVGLALGVIEGADALRAMGFDAEGAARQIGGGGQGLQQKIAGIKAALANSKVGQYAEEWNLDLDRLARSIATGSDYAKNEMGRLTGAFSENKAKLSKLIPLSPMLDLYGMLPGAKNLHSRVIVDELNGIIQNFRQKRRELRAEIRKAKDDFRDWNNFFKGGLPGGGPKGPKGGGPDTSLIPVGPIRRDTKTAGRLFETVTRAGRLMGLGLVNAGRVGGRAGDHVVRGLRPVPRAARGAENAAKGIGSAFKQAGGNVREGMSNASRNVSNGVGNMTSTVRSKSPQIPAAMRTAMSAFVTAVGAARGPASAAASSVVGGVKGAVQAGSGGMSSLGSSMMSGLAAGITATGFAAGGPVAAAAMVTAAVAAEVAKRAEVHSPSRVMMRIGDFIAQGLAEGIRGGERDVRRAAKRLWKIVGKADELFYQVRRRDKSTDKKGDFKWVWVKFENSAKAIRELKRSTRREFDVLERVAERREKVGKRLAKATNRLQNLVSARASFRQQVAGGINEFGSITSVVDANEGWATPKSVIDSLTQRLGKSRRFAHGVRRLLQRGIGKRAYRQLLEAGVEQAGATVDALLEATPRQLRRIRDLQGDIAGVGKRLGNESSGELYDAGVKAAKGLVKGLRSRQSELRKTARDTARTLVRELKRRLKIKSPSQIMAGIGQETVAGIDQGMWRRQKRLMRNARSMADRLASEMSPKAYLPRYAGDTRGVRAMHAAAAEKRYATTARQGGGNNLAPLIENLHLHVGDRDDIPAGMQEVTRTLRVIRRGGAHAFRAAGARA